MASTPEAVMAVVTDVTSAESVNHLADQAFDRYGAVHILCNNAGVGIKEAQRRLRTLTEHDWRWGFDVNAMGVVNAIRAFGPRMQGSGAAGHVGATSSGTGGLPCLP